MTSTPKWYCRNKSSPNNTFAAISKLGNDLRRITKRIIIDVKIDIFSEHDTILEECEKIIELYWSLKDESKNKDFLSLSKKIKRSPYNALLMRKFHCLLALNDHRFYQLTFVLKKTLSYLLRKSMQSEMWLNWALQITHLYNKSRHRLDLSDEGAVDRDEVNANICSNMYPSLLLPHKSIDFAYVLQLVSQSRIEQNSLDLMFGLFNMGEQDAWRDNNESNCSSLEILRILTLNLTGDGEFQQYYDSNREFSTGLQLLERDQGDVVDPTQRDDLAVCETGGGQSRRKKHTEHFLHKERIFISQLITKVHQICPSIFGSSSPTDLNAFIGRGIRLMWGNVGIILDHIILWWIDTPISCYSLSHIDSIRHWLYTQSVNDIPEPVFSTLRGIGEILTNFVSNNVWDQLFRLTLISTSCTTSVFESSVKQYRGSPKNEFGTPTGSVWVAVFANLVNLSNTYFPHNETQNSSLVPVAEQIPILHRIDHSVHSMRLWVKEQAKMLCNNWKMDMFFRILEHDVRLCLEIFATFKLPKLTADLTDILMLVCVALRTKLICEVNANIDKLKKTTDECVQIMSSVCRILSLANFKLCFPPPSHWQQSAPRIEDDQSNNVNNSPSNDNGNNNGNNGTNNGNNNGNNNSSGYVGFVLDQIFQPTIRATRDLNILKLVLKLICEAWLDHIYQQRIKFSVHGACRLLDDFDRVREWITSCPLLEQDNCERLSNHEVLRMCKGVGKILLRKPEDVISIAQSPKYDKRTGDDAVQETQLPSEMFVSNQKHWLQLRANNSSFPFLQLCCGNMS